MQGLFVTGTDTGVGKTRVSAMIARDLRGQGVRVGVYKPVCTGAEVGPGDSPTWRDVEVLWDAIDRSQPDERICPQRFRAAAAPPVAARHEGRHIDGPLLRSGARWWREHADFHVVEGVGGLLCPLTDEDTVADLARELGLPLLIVSPLELGTINHTLLTVEVARARRLPVAGIVLNEPRVPETWAAERAEPAEIARRCEVPILALLRHGEADRLPPDAAGSRIDWRECAARANAGWSFD